MSTQSNEQIKTLQVLRGIAATTLVFYHSNTNAFGGFSNQMFFVISGVVIAMILETDQKQINFLVNRITRIVPLYWIATTMVLILTALIPQAFKATTLNFSNYLKSIFFIPYFKENGLMQPMLFVGWTLNYEMFFYSCAWISLIITKTFRPLITSMLIIATFGFSHLTNNLVIKSFFGNTYGFYFIAGLLIYKIYKKRLLDKVNNKILFITSLTSYSIMAYYDQRLIGSRVFETQGIPCTLLITSIIALEKSEKLKTNKIFKFFMIIGDASYSIYLFHVFVFYGLQKTIFKAHPDSLLYSVTTILTSLLIGHTIHNYIDKPLTKFLRKKISTQLFKR